MSEAKQPPCCQNCPHLTIDGGCRSQDKLCPKWRAWFSREWAAIQAAAEAYRRQQTPETARRRPSVCVPKEDER